jgi:hypothetical protein
MDKQQKLFKFDLVLMLVFFAFFLGMVLVNIASYRFIHWVNLVLFMLPSMVLLGLYLFKRKHELKKLTQIIINISLGIILIVTTFINFGIMMVDEALSPNTSRYAYEHELKLYGFPDN